jgi:hypothetical protein
MGSDTRLFSPALVRNVVSRVLLEPRFREALMAAMEGMLCSNSRAGLTS